MFKVGDLLASGVSKKHAARVVSNNLVEILLDGVWVGNDDLTPAAIQWWGWTLASGVPNGETALAVCQHHVVDVGFRFSKLVCKKCDKEIKAG